jgi:pimeloyl-ACP methyl ester carboxylesterase
VCDFHPGATDLVLFLHGLACSREAFRYLFDGSYFPGTTLLVPDLPGFGLSVKPDHFSYTMEDQAEICTQLLSLFPFQRLHLVAHSMGGAIALLLSQQISPICSFANIEGNLISDDCGLLSRSIVNMPSFDYQSFGFAEHQLEFAADSQLRFDQTTATAVYRSARSLVRLSDSGELLQLFKQLPCRNVYFYGAENSHLSVLRELGDTLKIMVPDCGHGMTTDNPDLFYPMLAEFINQTGQL